MRRRDRHERGIRGVFMPAEHPAATTRAERFDDLVHDAVDDVEDRLGDRIAHAEFAVEDVPRLDDWTHDWVPLARTFPIRGGAGARVVVYRRPVETRATSVLARRALVRDVVAEEVATLLGVEPEEVDPGYGDDEPRRRRGGGAGNGPGDRP